MYKHLCTSITIIIVSRQGEGEGLGSVFFKINIMDEGGT